MKTKLLLYTAFIIGFSSSSLRSFSQIPGDIITLDLSRPTNPAEISFTEKGYWTETYSNQYPYLEFDLFSLTHLIAGNGGENVGEGMSYWDGFTVCNSGDNTDYGTSGSSDSWVQHQWGCMAGGGIRTDRQGNILTGSDGKITVKKGIPYLVAYWGYQFDETKEQCLQIHFKDGNAYEPQSIYINNHPWPYYGNIHGDSFCSTFEEGDYLKLFIHGLDENLLDNGKKVEYTLAEYKDGHLTQSAEWEKVDITSLGKVYGIYFTMRTTDFDPLYGPNTAVYFCMDKLQVKVPEPVALQKIELDPAEISIKQNETFRLKAIFTPEDAANKQVLWESSDENIATVSSSGQIQAVGIGKTTVTVTSVEGGYKASCLVEVVHNPVTEIRISDKALEMYTGQKYTLTHKIFPEKASNQKVEWYTSDPEIVRVNTLGEIECVAEGTTMVTVKSIDNGLSASCTISVLKVNKPVTGISFNVEYKELILQESFRLSALIEPEDADNKNITWSSDNESVASVDWSGRVTATGTGETTIRATTEDGGYTAECLIKVKNEYNSINDINYQDIKVYPNPVNEFLFIENNKNAIERITLTDTLGNVFFSQANPVNNTLRIRMAEYPEGIYIVKIIFTGKHATHRKIIKNNK
ncbi:MAG: Ig-like domain-containing protein [Bacteroidales bacterium]|nr:Ig-like domain-containing protein [Bacteroidales bacterium]